jgi:hypothetical protein
VIRLIFPDIDISKFDVHKLDSYANLKPLLDKACGAGVPEAQFSRLFSQCQHCLMLMTDRSKEYHRCPHGPASCDTLDNNDLLMLRLDCYNGGTGIREAHFKRLFLQCIYCDMFMTRWAAYNHTCEIVDQV